MIVVTGAAGFIGSCLIASLNAKALTNIVGVDDFGRLDKNRNLLGKQLDTLIHRDDFISWFEQRAEDVAVVFHIGARTDTTSTDAAVFERLNLQYSKDIWRICAANNIPLLYASSAATYGMGEHGFVDDPHSVDRLKPMNLYGQSKQDFDMWALAQEKSPPNWYGFKFFNVYGPNEYHKSRMASVIFHAFNQISATGGMKLFRSHRDDYEDGYQSRDFIYVKDVCDVLLHFHRELPKSGIYNLGTGLARPFLHLVQAVFSAMNETENISFIDTPADIRDTYQYFTEANMSKLRSIGYEKSFATLEEGVGDYVREYLMKEQYL